MHAPEHTHQLRAAGTSGRVAASRVAPASTFLRLDCCGALSWGTVVLMSPRLVDGASSSNERWLAGPAGPELVQPEYDHFSAGADALRSDRPGEAERYDEDYDYYWGDFRIPMWIALIWQVPWRQRLDIFVVGFLIGLVVAGVALLWGLLLSQY